MIFFDSLFAHLGLIQVNPVFYLTLFNMDVNPFYCISIFTINRLR